MGNRRGNQIFIAVLLIIGLFSLIGAGWILLTDNTESRETAVTTSTPNAATSPTHTALPPTPTIPQIKNITIISDSGEQTLSTQMGTVAQALQDANITLHDEDRTEPALDTVLQDGTVIQVTRAFPVTIEVDGRTYPIQTTHDKVSNILADAGIALVGLDYTIPDDEIEIHADAVIQVIRVTEDFRFEDTVIPYDTVYQANAEMEIDNRALVSAGAPGILRQQLHTRYENGVPVTETIDSERVAQAVVNEVIDYGTNIVIRTINTPDGPLEYWRVVRMKVTGYTAATSGKARDDPGYGITASGLQAGKGVVAIDPQVVPFRSNVYVEGYGQAVAGDTGGLVKGRIIDLGFDEGAYETWRGQVDVYYLTPLPSPEKINYLIPTTIP